MLLVLLALLVHSFICLLLALCLLNLFVLFLNFFTLQLINLVNYLLLPQVKISPNRSFWIHVFNFPLALEMHLSFLMTVILDMLISNEEIVLSIWYRIRLHRCSCRRDILLLGPWRLWNLQHVLLNLFLCRLIVALPVLTHVVGVKK